MANALSVTGLNKYYGGLHATRDVALEVLPSHVHAVIGPNGAGKTTLLSLLSGAQPADAGQVLLYGDDISHFAEQERVATGISRSFQITSVFDERTVLDNILIAVQRERHRGYGLFRASSRDHAAREAAREIAGRVGLGKMIDMMASKLTHGARKRLDVGLAVACQPRVLLMDEPMAGMGHEESGEMVELIMSLKREMTVVLVEHDMDAVFAVADRITVLVQGAVLVTDTVENVRNHPDVRQAYLGEEEAEA